MWGWSSGAERAYESIASTIDRRIGMCASRNEWYKPVDAWYGPQSALLTILMLTGLDGVTQPALVVRPPG